MHSLGELTPFADLALREMSYSVSATGQVSAQVRVLPLLTAVRLIVSQAQIISPEIAVDFSGPGWSALRKATEIRNRITHPKPDQDLKIDDDDLVVVNSSLLWLQATVEYVMASTKLALVRHNDAYRETIQHLQSGDPETLAAYEAALREIEADD